MNTVHCATWQHFETSFGWFVSVVDNLFLSLSYHAHDNLTSKLVIMKLSKLSDHVCYVM